ncbi:g9557 [Coccomyxa elongata]
MDWQPDSAVLPLSSLPLSEASFGLSSLQSKQSLGEKVSLGSKQMALSVLDILNAKPPGPPSPPQGEPASGPAEQPEAGQPSSTSIPEASPLTAGLDRELSVRNLPDPVPMQSPSRLADVAGPLTDPPPAMQPPLAEMCSPSGRVLPPAQYPLFTQMPSPIPSSAFGMHDQQQQPASPSSGLRAHSLDPMLARSARGTRAGSAGLADGSVRRTTRAVSTVAPAVQQPIRIELTPGAAPQTSGSLGTDMTLGAEPAGMGGTSSRPQRRAAAARGSGGGEKRKSSKKDDLRSKNREAQRRFREKQKAKLDQLEEKQAEVEEYKRRLERLQRDSDERLQGTATELRRLQLEKTMLQVRESRLVDMVGQLERVRASGVSPAERAQCLNTITAEASRVRSGRDADAAAAVLGKVLEYIKVEDFEGADAAALQGPDGRARCEALRLTSHMLQANRSQEGTIVTVKDLINLPRQSFVTLYAACVKELVPLMGQCPQIEPALEDPHGAFITPAELRIQSLVKEVRAVLCCFAATDAREACLQQLRHIDDKSPVDHETDCRTCATVLRAMNLTEEQERAVKEAHSQFVARQQSLAQHRAQALPYLRAALYAGADSSTQSCLRAHEAAALVRQTVDEECDNICSLSTFFLGRVVTDWQAAIMFARSHPYSAHIMGVIGTVVHGVPDNYVEELDRQGTGISLTATMDTDLSS